MGKGKLCPNCNSDIGIHPGTFAGIPTRIRCPNCNSKLKYVNSHGVTAFAFLSFIVLVLACIFLMKIIISNNLISSIIGVIISLILWIPCGIFFAKYLHNKKELLKY